MKTTGWKTFLGTVVLVSLAGLAVSSCKAAGMMAGGLESAIKTRDLVAAPVASPPAGEYRESQSVSLNSSTSEAEIYYTLDGGAPSSENGTLYSEPFEVEPGTTRKAVAVKTKMANSEVLVADYTLTGTLAKPIADPPGGSYAQARSVALHAELGASIYYTLDGNDPASAGYLYTGPFDVAMGTTLKAVATMKDMKGSAVMTETYTLMGTVVAPVANPQAGTYAQTQSVQLSSDTRGATIYYTLGDNIPDTEYSGAVSVPMGSTLRAVATKNGMTDSEELAADYVQMLKVAAPLANPPEGDYASAQNVSLQSATGGAEIYYTLGNGAPDIKYSGSVSVATGTTLKAVAKKSGMIDSDQLNAVYTLMGTAAAPVAAPAAGTILSTMSVSLSTTTDGAAIRYTVNGSDPSDYNGMVYSGPIPATEVIGRTLKAVALKAGLTTSAMTGAAYTQPKAATPEATQADIPASITSKTVTLSGPAGAVIRYTDDGATPGASAGQVYSSALTIERTTTLKAVAAAPGYLDSDVLERTYTIKAAAPQANVAAGTYTSVQSITLTAATGGAVIRYTVNGDEPTESATAYSTPVTVEMSKTIKAKAFKTGLLSSDMLTAAYVINMVDSVKISGGDTGMEKGGEAKTFTATVTKTGNPAETLAWSVSGGTKSSIGASSGVLTAPVDESASNLTVKAVSTANPGVFDTVTVTLTTLPKAAVPTASPPGGSYAAAQSVSLESATGGVSIYYTLGSGAPDIKYSGSISVAMNTTLRAVAKKAGMTDSEELAAAYTQMGTVAAPVAAPGAQAILSTQSITLTSATDGAAIRYTVNGVPPSSSNGLAYSGPIPAEDVIGKTLKAIAIKTGMITSAVTSAAYTQSRAASPTANMDAGTYISALGVTLSGPPGSVIRYTTDGLAPGASGGTVYSSALTIERTTTLKAVAAAAGYLDSEMFERTWTIKAATPLASVGGGTYSAAQTVTLTTATSGAVIRYTENGAEPTESGTAYSTPLTVADSKTLKAKAFKAGLTASDTLTAVYVITFEINGK
jgi:hypothetical protein